MSIRIGDRGRAATVLSPSGVILIDQRRYSARSKMEWIDSGQEVVILGGDNQGLLVIAVTEEFDPDTIDRIGDTVSASFGEAMQAAAAIRAEQEQLWLLARQQRVHRAGLVLGAAFTVAFVYLCWPELFGSQSVITSSASALLLLAGGMFGGKKALETIEHYLTSLDRSLHRISVPTACLLWAGFVSGLAWGVTQHGLQEGLLAGLAGALLIGLPLPGIALLISGGVDDAGG